MRDHLFISYAGEDGRLAEWLTLKLTREGCAVWCDKVKLLGGESYPRDIDDAIKNRTFRLVALLSRASLSKPNPLKERTLALNIGRERGIDFLIPLNVDGLKATELDWMTSDLTYIPFNNGWAPGFAQLLKKLASISAPRPLADPNSVVADWYRQRSEPTDRQETLWSNIFELEGVPNYVTRVELDRPGALTWPGEIPVHWQGETIAWALELPPGRLPHGVSARIVSWNADTREYRLNLIDVMATLLNAYLQRMLMQRGLSTTEAGDFFFPKNFLPKDRLPFTSYTGSRTWLLACGDRTFRVAGGNRERVQYHISITPRSEYRTMKRWVVQMPIRLYLTDASDQPLATKVMVRRRRAIGRMWFNHQWITRLQAISEWLAPDGNSVRLGHSATGTLMLAPRPVRLRSEKGIDESTLSQLVQGEDEELEDIAEESEGSADQ